MYDFKPGHFVDSLKFENIDNILYIVISGNVRNKLWHSDYGEIQHQLLFSRFDKLIINFASLLWIDPFPLISLINDLNILKSNKPSVIIQFYFKNLENGLLTDSQKRLFTFLTNEGAIDQFKNIGIIETAPDSSEVASWVNLISYKDSLVLPITVLNISKIDDTSIYVDILVNSILDQIRNKTSANLSKEIISKVKIALYELLENVNEHAYNDDEVHKYCTFYIRNRKGLWLPDVPKEIFVEISKNFLLESKNSHLLPHEFAIDKSNFFELFIVDSGKGITNTFFEINEMPKSYPLREAWREIYTNGKRKFGSKKSTNVSGLLMLNKLLENSFLFINEGVEILGDLILPDRPYSYYNASIVNEIKRKKKGLNLLIRLNLNIEVRLTTDWLMPSSEKIKNCVFEYLSSDSNVFDKYYNLNLSKLLESGKGLNLLIKDMRFRKLNAFFNKYPFNYHDKHLSWHISNVLFNNYENPENKAIILLGNELQLKTKLHFLLIDIVAKSKCLSRTIIIGELNYRDVILYESAIIEAIFPSEFYTKIEKIILITETLEVKVLKQSHHTYVYSFADSVRYVSTKESMHFNLNDCFKHYLELLKSIDSVIFWFYLHRSVNHDEYFVKASINWSSFMANSYINGYLHFGKTITDNFILKLYSFSLKRLKNISVQEVRYSGIDTIAKKLLESLGYDYQLNIHNHKVVTYFIINIGSVYVTGITEKNFDPSKFRNIFIHFFINESGINSIFKYPRYHFILWPKFLEFFKESKYKNNRLERVGNTSTIAPKGWKYFAIPRYDINLNSLTFVNPKQSYKDWQNNDFVKIGHFANERYHDIIGFDFDYYFINSFLYHNENNGFIFFRLCASVGIEESEILDTLLRANYIKFNLDYPELWKIVDIVVYPYHFVTNKIISYIKERISDKRHSDFIGLLSYTELTHNSQYSVSWLTIKQIEAKIINGKTKRILFFDDIILDRKISTEIEQILLESGAKIVYKFALLDRRRLSELSSNYKQNAFLWRLDLPRIGFDSNCLICSSLSAIKKFKNKLSSKICINRIDEVIRNWSLSNLFNIDSGHGLSGKNIFLNNSYKKFSISMNEDGSTSQIGGNENLINILTSHGLAIFCSEITSMTKKDDIILEILNDEDLDPDVLMECCCMILILFRNGLSNKTFNEIVSNLLRALIDSSQPNNYSALAMLTLVELYKYIDLDLLKSYSYMTLDPTKLKNLNNDILILLLYLAEVQEDNSILPNQLYSTLIKSNNKVSELYKELHFQMVNPNGLDHNTPLQKLTSTSERSNEIFRSTSFCLDKICDLLPKIDNYNIKTGTIESIENFKSEIIDRISDVNNELIKLSMYPEVVFENVLKKFEDETLLKVKNVMEKLKDFHAFIFKPINSQIKYDENTLNSFINLKLKEHVDIFLLNDLDYNKSFNTKDPIKWIIWDQFTEMQFEDLLSNKKHCLDFLKSEYLNFVTEYKFKMVVELVPVNLGIEIQFKNLTNVNANDVKMSYFSKSKYYVHYFEQIGGKIDFYNEKNLLISKMFIPYI